MASTVRLAGRSPILPGIDQVLSQADAGVRASDGDLSVGGAFHGVGNLDLSPRHLTDLVDLCTLAADDAADELRGGEKKQMSGAAGQIVKSGG